jgi:hypothetical protein
VHAAEDAHDARKPVPDLVGDAYAVGVAAFGEFEDGATIECLERNGAELSTRVGLSGGDEFVGELPRVEAETARIAHTLDVIERDHLAYAAVRAAKEVAVDDDA